MAIKRYLSEENLKRLMKEKPFLIKNIINSQGKLILCLRNNYFNVYYRGNSLAKVSFAPEEKYIVEMHSKFVPEEIKNDPTFNNKFKIVTDKETEKVYSFNIEQCELRKLLQKKYIEKIESKITQVNYKEELEFQHFVMEENIFNEEYCLIDIQITDESAAQKRIDMIGLKHLEKNKYIMVIMEVKLGNNKELEDAVYYQVKGYSEHVKKYFKCYKETYEKQYNQLKQLGLICGHDSETIIIEDEIDEMILVGRYIAKAKKQIGELIIHHPDIKDKIRLLTYEL